jgi:hypothetical protein
MYCSFSFTNKMSQALNFLLHKLYFGLCHSQFLLTQKIKQGNSCLCYHFLFPMKLTNHLHAGIIHLGVIRVSNSWSRFCPNRLRDTVNPWIRTFYQHCCFLCLVGFSLIKAKKSLLCSAKGQPPKASFKSTTLKHLKSCGILLRSYEYLAQPGVYFAQFGWYLSDTGLI